MIVTFTTLRATTSTDDKLMIFFLVSYFELSYFLFPENRLWHFIRIRVKCKRGNNKKTYLKMSSAENFNQHTKRSLNDIKYSDSAQMVNEL